MLRFTIQYVGGVAILLDDVQSAHDIWDGFFGLPHRREDLGRSRPAPRDLLYVLPVPVTPPPQARC
jgi:hypothetical protein